MIYRFDPEDPVGPGRGPEIISKKFTHFGSYSSRLRIPDITKVQPDVGAVVGYFTYHMDEFLGLSEIDFEWLLADPEIIYVGAWTGTEENLQRIGRTINMAKGIIYDTSYRSAATASKDEPLNGLQSQPKPLKPLKTTTPPPGFIPTGSIGTPIGWSGGCFTQQRVNDWCCGTIRVLPPILPVFQRIPRAIG